MVEDDDELIVYYYLEEVLFNITYESTVKKYSLILERNETNV